MTKKQKNWTPQEIQNKKAKKWQGILYATGVFLGLLALGNFDKNADDTGVFFALAAIIAFYLGSVIKTTLVKHIQANVYVKDKGRESLRNKFYGTGVICCVITFFTFNNAQDIGGFFFIVGIGVLIIGGLIPVKWVKSAEFSRYE